MTLALLELRIRVESMLRRRDDDRGAATVEYALLVVLIAVVCLIALTVLGTEASSSFRNACEKGFVDP